MRSWLLAAKIAAVFLLVMWTFVILTLHLFAEGVTHSGGDRMAAHHEFVVTVVQLGFVAMLLIIGLSIYVTAPLRRMSRSMDRIAAGELDLTDLCREAWTRVAEAAAAQGTTLQVRCADDARRIMAERSLAVRTLGNLFENSVRHAGPGEISVSSERHADRVQITVADEGPGVEEADLERLFEPFFRADRSRSRKTGAGGLGLMIVRRAVEAHGGNVEARRAQPRGLLVDFDLPFVSG